MFTKTTVHTTPASGHYTSVYFVCFNDSVSKAGITAAPDKYSVSGQCWNPSHP